MTTDIEVHEETAADVATVDATQAAEVRAAEAAMPMTALMVWALEARQAKAVAESLAKTSFVPASMQGKPHDITAAILAGHELGLQPMAALRSMDVIFGTPALRAHAMRGLVQSKGHEIELVESTPARCVMRGRRKGSEAWQKVEWTTERAAAMGLVGKDQWKKQPQTMLVARATGELCRLIAADVLFAMPYASEEIERDEAAPKPAPSSSVAELIGVPESAPAQPGDAEAGEA